MGSGPSRSTRLRTDGRYNMTTTGEGVNATLSIPVQEQVTVSLKAVPPTHSLLMETVPTAMDTAPTLQAPSGVRTMELPQEPSYTA